MKPILVHSPPLSRRRLLRGGALLAAGAAVSPNLAWARATGSERFANVTALVESYVAQRKLPGMLATIGLGQAAPEVIARGVEGFNDRDPVSLDSLFRIYSMTKPVTGIATMVLIDEGKLTLDQPLADILPKFAKMDVQRTPDGSVSDLRPARTAITIRHLLTHTAGLGYTIVQKGPLKTAYERAGIFGGQVSKLRVPGMEVGPSVESLELLADRLAELPLVYEPGTRWSYSVSLDLLGRVIEVVAGQPFDAFLAERIFEPLAMIDTFFQVPARETGRLTTNYVILAGIPVPIDPPEASIFAQPPPFPMGGSGLVSSPRDYDRFLAMLVNGGMLDGRRVLSEAAVRVATSDLMPPAAIRSGLVAGAGFGAGARVGLGAEAGTFGWGGAAGTVGLIDKGRGLRAALFTQYMPYDAYPSFRDFPIAVLADLRAMGSA